MNSPASKQRTTVAADRASPTRREERAVMPLVGGEAAFGRDRGAVHHARFVGGEEQGDIGDVLRLADSERVLSGYVVDTAEANLVAAGKATPDPFRQHDAGADGVDADTLGRVGAG